MQRKWPNAKFIAYFQAHTNTYANIETLKKVINCVQAIPDVYSVKRIQTSYAPHQNNQRQNKNYHNKNNASKQKKKN